MEGTPVQRLLCLADVHLMHDPRTLRPDQLRWTWMPTLTDHPWMPLPLLRAVTTFFRHTARTGFDGVRHWILDHPCNSLITVGDQLHGVQDRGIGGSAGLAAAHEFQILCDSLGVPTLFHVPSEHPLGFWNGEDYYPALVWKHGRRPRLIWKAVRHGRAGGCLSEGAITNWRRVFGPLWGSCRVEGLTFVWLDCDLLRWRDRFLYWGDKTLSRLAVQQALFLHKTLKDAAPRSVVLFTHRLEYVYQFPVALYDDRIHAVVFGDYHDSARAKKVLVRFPDWGFHRYFVPALWTPLPNRRTQGFGVLTVEGNSTSYQSYNLNGLPLG